ncbi:MAG: hypothetical protein ACODAA_00610 [Gemmatimonadota bacterium]
MSVRSRCGGSARAAGVLFVVAASAMACVEGHATPAQTSVPVGPEEAAEWREDLGQFAHVMVEQHGNVYHTVSPERFEAMVSTLHDRIPDLARHEIIVEMQRIAAAIGDGHTAVLLFFDEDVGFHQLPVRFGWYEEGVFVEAAHEDAGVVPGARLVTIGGVPVHEAVARVTPLISRDNDIWIRVMAPMLLGSPEVLHAVGLSGDPAFAVLGVEHRGRRTEVRLQASEGPFVIRHGAGAEQEVPPGWTDARAAAGAPVPLWQQRPGEPYWYEYLPEARVLYIQYDMVNDAPHGPGVHEFFAEALGVLNDPGRPVERVALDIRSNSGGEGGLNAGVVRQLIRRDELQHPGSLVVIIGRRTFSAAQALAHELDRWTPAVFIGEPTGSSPQFWGDHRVVELANSGVDVSASPTWWQPGGPYDRRDFLPPLLAFEPWFADYVAGRDPAVEAVLAWEDQELRLDLDEDALTALTAGDTAGTARIAEAVAAWDANPIHRYRPATAELNRMGYALLRRDRSELALAVFRLNVELHPKYANGWDSLGEVLLHVGRRDEGLAAYRRAFELDPDVGRAAAVLRGRDGAH